MSEECWDYWCTSVQTLRCALQDAFRKQTFTTGTKQTYKKHREVHYRIMEKTSIKLEVNKEFEGMFELVE